MTLHTFLSFIGWFVLIIIPRSDIIAIYFFQEDTVLSFSASKRQLLKDNRGGVWSVFGIACLCAACFFVPYMIWDGGYFTYFGDFNVQQIPFYQLCHNAIRNGEWGWSFGTDLGANFIGSYTFYTITSPFFWLTLPFPNTWVPFFMGPLLILKFGCSALTAFLFIRRFTRKKETAQLGALLYAFSGFSLYNVFFNHFHEAIVFFPLLLLAFEMLMTENKRGVFAVAVAICAAVNYFFFVGMLVFGIIYFVLRLVSRAIKPSASQIFALFFEAILGMLIAFAVLWPSYLAIAGNSRVSEIDLGWNSILFGKESIYANVFEVFFFPPDLPARPVFFPEADVKWSSLGAWMPVFSMVGVFTYCAAKKGSWLKRIIITCAVMAFVPILNSAFYMFNNAYYVRWFYMPILMMALATALAIEENGADWKQGFKRVSLITLIITAVVGFFPQTVENEDGEKGLMFGLFTEPDNIMYIARFWITCGVAIGGLVVLALILKERKRNLKKFLRNGIICVTVLTVGFANFYIASGKSHSYTHEMVVDTLIEGELKLEGNPDTFRIDTYSCMDNSGMFLGYSSINAFHSIVPSSIMEFYESVGENRDVASRPETDTWAIRSLLSVKYLIQATDEESFIDEYGNPKMPGFEYLTTENGFDVYKNTNFIGYGFSYDCYMTEEQFETYGHIERSKMLNRAILLTDEQVQKYGKMLSSLSEYYEKPQNNVSTSYFEIKKEIKRRGETSATSFKTGKNSFKATVERDKPNLVFFSVPYDEGWSATVNGKPVEVEKVNVGFMAVAVPAGQSEIVFTYKTPGLSLGITVSAVALVVLAIYITAVFIWRKKHPVNVNYPEGDELLEKWVMDENCELLSLEPAEEDNIIPQESENREEENSVDE